MSRELKKISARFTGAANNHYSTGKTYELQVQQGRYTNIRVQQEADRNGSSVVVYDNIIDFLTEWDCVNCIEA